MIRIVLLAFLMLGVEAKAQSQPQVQLSGWKNAGASDIYGFEYRNLSIGGRQFGCVHKFFRLSEDLAAVWRCEIQTVSTDPLKEDYGILRDWCVVNLYTGEACEFEAPHFWRFQSCPSFRGEYAAYYGIYKERPEDHLFRVDAIVFDWKEGKVVERKLLGLNGFETDAPCSVGSPQWDEDPEGLSVIFKPEWMGLEEAFESEVRIELCH